MALPGRETRHRESDYPGPPTAVLAAMEAAHREVEPCIVALEAIMSSHDVAAPGQFSVLRHRLARANLNRTLVARRACSQLISMMPIAETGALRDLQQSEVEHFKFVSKHIQDWDPRRVQDDWSGYCHATRKLLERVRELIATERKLLMPLLQ